MRLRISHRILLLVFLLCAVGITFVYSASSITATALYGSASYYLKKQFLWFALGLMALVVMARLPLEQVRRWSFAVVLVLVVFLVVVLFQEEVNGAHRWLRLGPMSIQPSEFAKIGLILYAAHKFAQCTERGQPARQALGHLVLVNLVVLMLILNQPDRGTLIIMAFVLYLQALAAGIRRRSALLLLLIVVPYVYFDFFMGTGYEVQRIQTFLNPAADIQGKGYQAYQASIAIGSGGLLGAGIGEGRQKIFYLPEAHTDFIFAVLAEEIGFLGSMGVLVLYALLIVQLILVGRRAHTWFEAYLVYGLSTLFMTQVFINLGVTNALLPTKGLTLPFLSYGGSSMLAAMILIGLVLNVALRTERGVSEVPR